MKHTLAHAAGVYVLITFLLYALTPVLADQPIWARTLALVPLMLLGIRFVINPMTATLVSRRAARDAPSRPGQAAA